MRNLVIEHFLSGFKKRLAFKEKHGFASPPFMLISPTMRCNLNCRGCWASEYTREPELDQETGGQVRRQRRAGQPGARELERSAQVGRVEEQLALPWTRRSAITPVTSASLILILFNSTADGARRLAGRVLDGTSEHRREMSHRT